MVVLENAKVDEGEGNVVVPSESSVGGCTGEVVEEPLYASCYSVAWRLERPNLLLKYVSSEGNGSGGCRITRMSCSHVWVDGAIAVDCVEEVGFVLERVRTGVGGKDVVL